MADACDRKGVVKVAVACLSDLFGQRGRVAVEAVFLGNDGNLMVVVSGHPSLPVVGPGDHIPEVFAEIHQSAPDTRTVDFRAAPSHARQ